MVKIVRFGVSLVNDNVNTLEYVVESLQEVMNWDVTQAGNCANIVHMRGDYVLTWYDSEKAALATATMLQMKGLKVKLIIDKSGTI